MNILHFAILSIILHLGIFSIPLNLNNSNIRNDFTDENPGTINVTIVPQKRIVTQQELNAPILEFMEQENFDLLLEEIDNCDPPFQQ